MQPKTGVKASKVEESLPSLNRQVAMYMEEGCDFDSLNKIAKLNSPHAFHYN